MAYDNIFASCATVDTLGSTITNAFKKELYSKGDVMRYYHLNNILIGNAAQTTDTYNKDKVLEPKEWNVDSIIAYFYKRK